MEKEFKPKEQEPKTNQPLFEILTALDRVLKQKGDSPLQIENGVIRMVTGEKPLVEITDGKITALGEDFSEKISTDAGMDKKANEIDFNGLLENLSIVRLNSLGVCYGCDNWDEEVVRLTKLATENGISAHEEESTDPNERWLFFGDTQSWEKPLFRVVLYKGSRGMTNEWVPGFIIDVDTNATIEELRAATIQYLSANLAWEYDIPDYGVVVVMVPIGGPENTKLTLGFGTNLRNTKVHRESFRRLS